MAIIKYWLQDPRQFDAYSVFLIAIKSGNDIIVWKLFWIFTECVDKCKLIHYFKFFSVYSFFCTDLFLMKKSVKNQSKFINKKVMIISVDALGFIIHKKLYLT